MAGESLCVACMPADAVDRYPAAPVSALSPVAWACGVGDEAGGGFGFVAGEFGATLV